MNNITSETHFMACKITGLSVLQRQDIYNPSGIIQYQDLQTPFLIKKKIEGLLRP